MKVLRVIDSMNPSSGGPCQGIRNSISELKKKGISNEVVSLDDPSDAFLGKDPFPIHALGPRKGPWRYSEKLVPWLHQNLNRFDAVIVHGLWLYPSYATRKAILTSVKSTQKPKLFVMPHGMLDPYFQRADSRKLKAIRNWLYWKLIEKKVVNEAEGVLFTCEAELQLAREPFHPYHPKREINVGYGVPAPPVYTPLMQEAFLTKCTQLENKPYLLFLSRIHEKKGVDLLIKAYQNILEASSGQMETIPKLVIAGPGLEFDYGQKIQQTVNDNPLLRSFIVFPGMLTGEAKWGAFYGCEAFILPSHQENFGIAVVEALACGKPVLISNQVNIWREIEAEGGGLVTPNTIEGTQQNIERWLGLSPENKLAMKARAKATFENNFAIAPAASRLLDAISSS